MESPVSAQAGASGVSLSDNVYQQLLKERIIWLGGPVQDDNANALCAQLLMLAAADPDEDIYLYINSPGGSVTAGMAIYDTMQYVRCDVATTCVGMAASMGAVLLTAGAEGKRHALPHSRVMIHQPLGGVRGQASDIEIEAQEILRLKQELSRILAEHSGQSIDQIILDSDRNKWMTADEAKEYGLIDQVMRRES